MVGALEEPASVFSGCLAFASGSLCEGYHSEFNQNKEDSVLLGKR